MSLVEDLQVGDSVRLIGLPEWLIHDLPLEEQMRLHGFVGGVSAVEKIDQYGYVWIEFGVSTTESDCTKCTGHSFCVTREYLEKI